MYVYPDILECFYFNKSRVVKFFFFSPEYIENLSDVLTKTFQISYSPALNYARRSV